MTTTLVWCLVTCLLFYWLHEIGGRNTQVVVSVVDDIYVFPTFLLAMLSIEFSLYYQTPIISYLFALSHNYLIGLKLVVDFGWMWRERKFIIMYVIKWDWIILYIKVFIGNIGHLSTLSLYGVDY